MKKVTVHFVGGAPLVLSLPEKIARSFVQGLAADPRGTTEITGSDGILCVINRNHMTYAEIAE